MSPLTTDWGWTTHRLIILPNNCAHLSTYPQNIIWFSAFGFLYTNYIENDQTNTGNWGFLDQQKAIKWVNENIANFNGDPDRITVFGESAGAISSIQHVINSESSKYFRRAIIQSNPLTIPFKEPWEAGIQGMFQLMTKVDLKVPFPVTVLISQIRLLLMRDKNLTATLLFGGEVLKKL